MNPCANEKCDRFVESGICPRCERLTATKLGAIPALWVAAHAQLHPVKSGASGGSDMSIGIFVSALSFVEGSDILGVLTEWESEIRQERSLSQTTSNSKPESLGSRIDSTIEFAVRNLPWSAAQYWAGLYMTEINHIHRLGIEAGRQFNEKTMAISCPNDMPDGSLCGATLRIRQSNPETSFTCQNCDRDWDLEWLSNVSLATSQAEIWADKEDLADQLGISEKAVMKFAKSHDVPIRRRMVELRSFMAARGAKVA